MRVIQPLPATDQTAFQAAVQPHRNRFSVSRTAGTMPVYAPKSIQAAAFADPETSAPKVETGQKLRFSDIIDVFNPLQNIPVVNTIYRKITGDQISAPAQFVGGFLFGGPIGGVAAMADIAMKEQTGRSFSDRAFAMMDKNSSENPAQTPQPSIQLASRAKDEPRTAGYMPVWGQSNPVTLAQALPPVTIPTGNMSSETNFAMLLNSLSPETPNIS